MYIPRQYEWKNKKDILSFMTHHPFAILINQHDGKPWATHTPILPTKKEGVLFGHIAKANPQWKSFSDEEVLIIYNGPNSYISSSWYDHESVPTWNYLAVHVYGTIKKVDSKKLWDYMSTLMHHFEKSEEQGQRMEELSSEYLEKEMKGIVGFEIHIQKIEAVEKMSQGKNQHNLQSIEKKLRERNHLQDTITANRLSGKNE